MDGEGADFKENAWIDAGAEDELSARSKRSWVTPRNSVAGKTSPIPRKPTPYATLRQLAAIIRKPSTPRRRASNGAPPFPEENAAHPPNLSRTPSSRLPLQVSRADRSNPTTPHAIRALQQRRATPGRDRRKSGRLQRETPRDALRQLSKLLAPISEPLKPSPLPVHSRSLERKDTVEEDFEDELDLPQPRFSIAIDDGAIEDDSFQEPPPRLSMPLDEVDQTGRSVEIGRRAISEQPRGRLSRGSFGSIRASDRFTNVEDNGLHDVSKLGIDDSLVDRMVDADADELGDLGGDFDLGGDTEDLKRVIFESSGRGESRYSEPQHDQQPDTDALSPFVLAIPSIDHRESSPIFAHHTNEHFDDVDDLPRDNVQGLPAIVRKPFGATKPRIRIVKPVKRSRHGIPYSSLPPRITKRLASTFLQSLGTKKTRLGKEALKAIVEASDQYFEQLSEDLGAFAHHAGRKKIDESDAIAVMKRQRIVSATSTTFSLAHKHLPGELVQDMRLPPLRARPQPRKRRLGIIVEDEDEGEEEDEE